jgi:hypothetical protein
MRVAGILNMFTAGLVAATMLAAPAQAQFTVGDPLVARGGYDTFRGFILIAPYTFSAPAYGQAVSSVSIFDGAVGRDFTPLILASSGGGNWTITGVGTQRIVGASGLQTYDFGLTSGSNIVDANTRLGWLSGSELGAIQYTQDPDSDDNMFVYSSNALFLSTVGATFAQLGVTDRAYSIQFTTQLTTVPEPSTLALTAGGLLALVVAAQKRRRD